MTRVTVQGIYEELKESLQLEMLSEMGTCPGVENYSRHLTGRAPGEPPPTLLDYLPRLVDFVTRHPEAPPPEAVLPLQ